MRNPNKLLTLGVTVALALGSTACSKSSAESPNGGNPQQMAKPKPVDEIVQYDQRGHEIHYLSSGERVVFPVYSQVNRSRLAKVIGSADHYDEWTSVIRIPAILQTCVGGDYFAGSVPTSSAAGGNLSLVEPQAAICADNVLTPYDFRGQGETSTPPQ